MGERCWFWGRMRCRGWRGWRGLRYRRDELAEVAARFGSLMLELGRLEDLDLSDVEPVSVFPDEG